ncbi:MAG: tail fiber domain-containing protein [Pseudomonas sp.]
MKPCKKITQLGLSVIEMAFVLCLTAILIGGIHGYAVDARNQIELRNDAQHFSLLVQAAERYIQENQPSLGSSLNAVVPSGDLQPFLPLGIVTTQGGKRNQNVSLLIRQISPAIGTTPAQVQGLLVSHGGQGYNESELEAVAQSIGAVAGTAGNISGGADIRGVSGSWVTPVSSWSFASATAPINPGYIMALVTMKNSNNGLIATPGQRVVYRDAIAGKPELNEMNTDLGLWRSLIISDGTLRSNGTVMAGDVTLTSSPGMTQRVTVGSIKAAGLSAEEIKDVNRINLVGDARINGKLTAGHIKADYIAGSSDRSMKSNLEIIDNALDKINKINGYEFTWKKNQHRDVGVIAQEIESIFPQLVTRNKEGNLAVNYNGLVAPLIEAVKDIYRMSSSAKVQLQELLAEQNRQRVEVDQLKVAQQQQKRDLLQLKHALKQTLSVEERTLCGALCAE